MERQVVSPPWSRVAGRGLFSAIFVALILATFAVAAKAAPYAAYVMDARTGETLYSKNADTALHPASLTKMMTLYLTFEAIQHGDISLDSYVTVSRHAASMPPSKLGMRIGQKIKLRYLIRAAAIKSANDAATAICEAVGGSQAAFADRMNRTAKEMGMTHTHFVNCNGLTAKGHLSSAHDMAILGRHLFFDFPQYYNLFSRITADADGKTVYNTNRKFLRAYRGADGIKTGYTYASGFNLVGSAQRGDVRVIGAVFGATSTPDRNAKMEHLLDIGFSRAPAHARTIPPAKPRYGPEDSLLMAARSTNAVRAPMKSLRPTAPPSPVEVALAEAAQNEGMDESTQADEDQPGFSEGDQDNAPSVNDAVIAAVTESVEPPAVIPAAVDPADVPGNGSSDVSSIKPMARPDDLLAHYPKLAAELKAASGGGAAMITRTNAGTAADWSVNVGRFTSAGLAQQTLTKTALTEIETLENAEQIVVRGSTGYDAVFAGLTHDAADRTCQRLNARNITCFMVGPNT